VGGLVNAAPYRIYDEADVFIGVATASACDESGATLTALRLMTPLASTPENH
jgi:hypothetical protein